MKTFLVVAGLGLSLLATTAFADSNHPPMQHAQADHDEGMSIMAHGVVRKIDKSRGRITIKHGPLRDLDMPPMTMVFRVKDEAMLERFKPGDEVRFKAEDIGGALTVTEIQPAE
ncbi:MAG: copper-binding protein [Rhodocyclaceae bacterium]|nr:copper-binding protein [Rhodocyclaceae bacterium]